MIKLQQEGVSHPVCPNCGHDDVRVRETRPARVVGYDLNVIRRRRGCTSCGKTFPTIECGLDDLARLITSERTAHLRDLQGIIAEIIAEETKDEERRLQGNATDDPA